MDIRELPPSMYHFKPGSPEHTGRQLLKRLLLSADRTMTQRTGPGWRCSPHQTENTARGARTEWPDEHLGRLSLGDNLRWRANWLAGEQGRPGPRSKD